MSEALVPPAVAASAITDRGAAGFTLPQLIVDAGPDAVARFLEFFAARGEGGGGAALRAGLCARERLRAVRGARRRGRGGRQGRGVGMSESLVPVAAEPTVVAGRGTDVVLPRLIVEAGPSAVARFFGVLRGADRKCEDAGGVRAGRGAVSDLVRGPRPRPGRDRPAPRGRLHPDPPRIGPDRQAAPGGGPPGCPPSTCCART